MIDNIGADTCSQVKYAPVEELGLARASVEADRGFPAVLSRSDNCYSLNSSPEGWWSDILVFETDQSLHCHAIVLSCNGLNVNQKLLLAP